MKNKTTKWMTVGLLLLTVGTLTACASQSQKPAPTSGQTKSSTSSEDKFQTEVQSSQSTEPSASSSQASEVADNNTAPINTTIPSDLVGTWIGSGPGGAVTATYTEGGDITIEEQGQVKTGKISSYEEVEPGLYRVTSDASQYIEPTFNLGGAGFRYETGFRISGNQLTYVYWTGPMDTSFDASTYRKSELTNWIYEKQ